MPTGIPHTGFRKTAGWATELVERYEAQCADFDSGRTARLPSLTKALADAYRVLSREPLRARSRARGISQPRSHEAPAIPLPAPSWAKQAQLEQEIGRLVAELFEKCARLAAFNVQQTLHS